jgi:hypothetical protein
MAMSTGNTQDQKTFSERLAEAIAREKRTGIEFCTSCANDVDFTSSLHVDHPTRYRNGAYYNEGGQTCALCAAEERKASVPKKE